MSVAAWYLVLLHSLGLLRPLALGLILDQAPAQTQRLKEKSLWLLLLYQYVYPSVSILYLYPYLYVHPFLHAYLCYISITISPCICLSVSISISITISKSIYQYLYLYLYRYLLLLAERLGRTKTGARKENELMSRPKGVHQYHFEVHLRYMYILGLSAFGLAALLRVLVSPKFLARPLNKLMQQLQATEDALLKRALLHRDSNSIAFW